MEDDHSILGLATIRRNRGITLEQIAQLTKISMRSLRAIEDGEFQKLPGGVYDTNYLRQYAGAIDFDAGTLLAYYHQKKMSALNPAMTECRERNDRNLFGGFRPASTALRS